MEDILVALLSTLGYPVIRQGSLSPDAAYPDTFLTFWNSDEDGNSFYDNECCSVVHSFDVNVYSNNPCLAYSVLRDARTLLRSNGWIIASRGYDVPSDESTHIGRGFEVQFLEQLELTEQNAENPQPSEDSEENTADESDHNEH